MSRVVLLSATIAAAAISAAAAAQVTVKPPAMNPQPRGGPTGNPGGWFTDDDYPAGAKKRGEQGRVTMLLSINKRGVVSACRVTQSSGSADLDKTSCDLAIKRATFSIQRDVRGKATSYSYQISTRWVLANP